MKSQLCFNVTKHDVYVVSFKSRSFRVNIHLLVYCLFYGKKKCFEIDFVF